MEQHRDNGRRTSVAADARIRSVAPENSARLKAFYRFLPAVSTFFRQRRMKAFLALLDIKPGTQVLDLGGVPAIWEHVAVPLEVTLLNLPRVISPSQQEVLQSPGLRHHKFHLVEGDACNVVQFADRSFERRVHQQRNRARRVAGEAGGVRLRGASAGQGILGADAVQMVSPRGAYGDTVLLALSGMGAGSPDAELAEAAARRWADYISTTRVLSRRRMAELFPDGATRAEYFLVFPKSYIAYSRAPSSAPASTAAAS